MATLKDLKFTVRDAAERFGKNPSRIRQICIQYEIGLKFDETSVRMLTENDLDRIGTILEKTGRERKN